MLNKLVNMVRGDRIVITEKDGVLIVDMGRLNERKVKSMACEFFKRVYQYKKGGN